MFSLGSIPYPGVENYEMFDYLNQGLRLKQPSLCPNVIFDLMQACWVKEPHARPCFEEMVTTVEDIIMKYYTFEEH